MMIPTHFCLLRGENKQDTYDISDHLFWTEFADKVTVWYFYNIPYVT